MTDTLTLPDQVPDPAGSGDWRIDRYYLNMRRCTAHVRGHCTQKWTRPGDHHPYLDINGILTSWRGPRLFILFAVDGDARPRGTVTGTTATDACCRLPAARG
jgi:hypothetical protein